MDKRSLWGSEEYEKKSFSFPALLQESVNALQRDGNTAGLSELSKAIPAVKPLIDQALARESKR